MDFKTSISKMTADDHTIRGEKLSALMKGSFSDAVFLILKGEKPTTQQSKIFEAMLISILDHGMGTTSSMASRFVASGGNSINASIAGGVLALGDYHGGAIEKAMVELRGVSSTKEFVGSHLEKHQTLYGFGHKVYKERDPRVTSLLQICEDENFRSPYIDLVKEIENEIATQKGTKIPLNIDGLIAAILLAMDFDPLTGKAVFVIARTSGLAAQVIEELKNEPPVRRIDESNITYEGK